jgi:hypothetical protein
MNIELVCLLTFACLVGAVVIGMGLRRALERHLNDDTKDAVKLATGFLATMAALVLGLLISSAKGTYDTARNGVIEMAGKVVFLDRVLAACGPEADEARSLFRGAVAEMLQQMWPNESDKAALIAPDTKAGYGVFAAIQRLAPHDDIQRSAKAEATRLAIELGQLRSMLLARSTASISRPMLIVLIYWLTIIFLAFSLLAPNNATATLALIISALSVSGAVFLIMELDRPFGGYVRIPSEPMRTALSQMAQTSP